MIGDFFAKKHISRSLINLDFNRDGRVDSLMTHMFDPVSLLANRSESKSKSVTFYLKSTRSPGDAIGSKVQMQVAGNTIARQLIGGSGFQCSNQRNIHVGLGSSSKAEQVIVHWPSGHHESFGTVQAGSEWLLVEGDGVPFELPR
jgi:hypothetical protein